ncbi:predicted protein [Streptomyces viridochromogenes DSM 40736]|uniref:Predicted protein n=1 Tax=Streptomyces viridochromogenes (strain DSM 40736 / JCM 4977 / BCRC 1201 / Tue 494) TaxID=591159 RepID=D9X0A9_STRVT|nr:hypothetical protein [Streptomyces viridochromogenes]EFL35493.1 predicted protein [Streptomyces viridochromogenes DSM 40736]
MAKGFWHVVMKATGAELDPASAQWAAAERAEVHAELATVAVRRELSRTRARIRDEESALADGGSVTALEWITPAADGLTPERLAAAGEQTADRIRIAQSGGSGSGQADPSQSGSVKDAFRALFESGTRDTDDIVRALPDANAETVKRHIRTVRSEGGYA